MINCIKRHTTFSSFVISMVIIILPQRLFSGYRDLLNFQIASNFIYLFIYWVKWWFASCVAVSASLHITIILPINLDVLPWTRAALGTGTLETRNASPSDTGKQVRKWLNLSLSSKRKVAVSLFPVSQIVLNPGQIWFRKWWKKSQTKNDF